MGAWYSAIEFRRTLGGRSADACLIQDCFGLTEQDVLRNRVLVCEQGTLASPRSNRAIKHLLDHLNAAEFTYTGTNLRLTYTLCAPLPKRRKDANLVSYEIRSSEGFAAGGQMAECGLFDLCA